MIKIITGWSIFVWIFNKQLQARRMSVKVSVYHIRSLTLLIVIVEIRMHSPFSTIRQFAKAFAYCLDSIVWMTFTSRLINKLRTIFSNSNQFTHFLWNRWGRKGTMNICYFCGIMKNIVEVKCIYSGYSSTALLKIMREQYPTSPCNALRLLFGKIKRWAREKGEGRWERKESEFRSNEKSTIFGEREREESYARIGSDDCRW